MNILYYPSNKYNITVLDNTANPSALATTFNYIFIIHYTANGSDDASIIAEIAYNDDVFQKFTS